jgi:hypothetical protein
MTLYIRNQAQHHARKSFDHELKMILKRHGIVPLGERLSRPCGTLWGLIVYPAFR